MSSANVQHTLARAVAAHQAGDLAGAEFLYKLVLSSDKKQFDALHLLGVIEAQRGNLEEARRQLTAAVRTRPNSLEAQINLGGVQVELREDEHALKTLTRVLSLDPRSVLAHNNLSIVLRRMRRFEEALAHAEQAVSLNPSYADAWNNRANVLYDLKRLDEAWESYGRALTLNPRLAEAYLGRANLFSERDQLRDALAEYDKALAVKPTMIEAWGSRALVCERLGNFAEALAANAKIRALKPETELVEGAYFVNKLQICDWTDYEAEQAHILAEIRRGVLVIGPFQSLSLDATSADLHQITTSLMQKEMPASPAVWRGERYEHHRIRVAYLSADFREHPVSHLLAGVLARHDRSRFEPIAISFRPRGANPSPMRQRLETQFERFIDVDHLDDDGTAELMRDLEIDIAIDLMGHTLKSRPRLYALRPSPVQVNYLGYAGTFGSAHMDYIIADRCVIPEDDRRYFSEKVAYLPHTFMPGDNRRPIADAPASRSEQGLPEHGFVFCSFNQSQKITPDVYAIWMRLLAAVEGSVLWLTRMNQPAVDNLRRQAQAHGIDGERVLFTRLVDRNEEHLARHRLADLFLNTTPYNSHSTAVDALWAGVPIVTTVGKTFGSRVTASILDAAGLPDLIVPSLAEYETLALKLATDPAMLTSVKERLQQQRKTAPLFDTDGYVHHLEAAYHHMWERAQRGEPPDSFSVSPAAAT